MKQIIDYYQDMEETDFDEKYGPEFTEEGDTRYQNESGSMSRGTDLKMNTSLNSNRLRQVTANFNYSIRYQSKSGVNSHG